MSQSELSELVQRAREGCACNQRQAGDASAKAASPASQSTAEASSTNGSQSTEPAATIDVSHLPPPLPMVRILEMLRELGPGPTLRVHHTRRPNHLYPKLEALGCTHETVELASGKIELLITTPLAGQA